MPALDTNCPIHAWFGLSRASYAVIPRLALQNMPEDWQQRFVDLMTEAAVLGLRTPDYEVNRRSDDGKRGYMRDPWKDYRHGDFVAANGAALKMPGA